MSTDRAVAMGLKDLTITKDKISFSYMKGNERFDVNRRIKANPGLADIDESTIRAGRWPKEYEYVDFVNPDDGTPFTVKSQRRGFDTAEDPVVSTMNAVRSEITGGLFNDSESVVLANIQPMLTKLGLTTAQANIASAYRIKVTNPATEATHTINTDEGASAAEALNSWIAGQLTTETADRFVKLNPVAGSGGGGASKYDKANQ